MPTTLSQRLKILIDSKKTVYTTQDLQDLWQEKSLKTVIISAKRMVEKKLILKLAKGYYALNKEYSVYELANLIISPSYISFNSALFYWNVCFQAGGEIDSVALLNYKKKIKNKIYKYYAMKKDLFFNLDGIIIKNNLTFALAERAILDSLYFGFLPNIDNEKKINFSYLKKLSLIYPLTIQNKIEEIYGKKI